MVSSWSWDLTSAAIGFAATPLLFAAVKLSRGRSHAAADSKPRPGGPLKVVITGSTKGLGLALAEEFLSLGDAVVISSRNADRCTSAAADLATRFPSATVRSFAADVGVSDQAEALADFAVAELARIDIWVNNAGASQPTKGDLLDSDPGIMQEVVKTNLLGSIYGSRAAMRVMRQQQPPGGKIFLIDGQGSDGRATPKNAAYGCTKAALVQLKESLAAQVRGSGISVHLASPGMVATDLLAVSARSAPRAARFLNVLAEEPRTVAAWLVPRMRGVSGNGKYFRYLTPLSALYKLMTGWRSRRGRFYSEDVKLQ